MYNYVKYGVDGNVVATLTSPVAFEGDTYDWVLAPPGAPRVVPVQAPAPFVVTYDDLRKQSYPSIETQLDMLYHAMDSGELPVATGFYNAIKAVKDRYPVGYSAAIGELPTRTFESRIVLDFATPQVGVTYRLKYGATYGAVVLNTDGSGFFYDSSATADRFTYERVENGIVREGVVELVLPPLRLDDGNSEAPFAADDVFIGPMAEGFLDNVSGNDRPSVYGPYTWAITTQPKFGAAVMSADGTFQYNASEPFQRVDAFTYSLTDANGNSAIATAVLLSTPVIAQPPAAPPIARDDNFTGVAGALLEGNLATNDGDSPGEYWMAMPPLYGTATVQLSGAFTYTPKTDADSDTFVYALRNAGGESFATVTLSFTPADGEELPEEEMPPDGEVQTEEPAPADKPFFIP